MSPFGEAEAPREISDVNVVPLADVSLVLLIILLVLSPMMEQAMVQVRAAGRAREDPAAEAAGPADASPMVLAVSLSREGLSVGDRRFSARREFAAYLSGELAARPGKKVFLAPEPDVPHGAVVDALEAIAGCGAESVALVQTEAR